LAETDLDSPAGTLKALPDVTAQFPSPHIHAIGKYVLLPILRGQMTNPQTESQRNGDENIKEKSKIIS
jgi:hypothetical protein